MIHIKGPETRKCPKEVQDRLTRTFGRNQFGDPHFKIVWGQSQFIRMGNVWRDVHGNERAGYRDRYQVACMPCWVIMRWKSPIEYGSPRTYYMNTWLPAKTKESSESGVDSHEGYYVTAEYPWRGRYEVMQALISKRFEDGKLVITHFPLTHYLIDTLIPLMIAFQSLSRDQQLAARDEARRRKEEKDTEELAEKMMENLPRWYGPVSYNAQGCRTSLLDRKMQLIQRRWDLLAKHGLKPVFQKGLAQGNRPQVSLYR